MKMIVIHAIRRVLMMCCLLAAGGSATQGVCSIYAGFYPNYSRMSVIFLGKVIGFSCADETVKIDSDKSGLYFMRRCPGAAVKVKLQILDALKGISGDNAVVRTGGIYDESYYDFKMGKTYLVFANKNPETDEMTNSGCSPTHLVNDSDTDQWVDLARWFKTNPPGAILFGSISRSEMGLDPLTASRSMSSVPVHLKGANGEFSTLTDVAGVYNFSGLPAGGYKVTVDFPKDGWVWKDEASEYRLGEMKVADGIPAEDDFWGLPDSAIRGKVFGPDEKPLEGILVDIVPVEKVGKPWADVSAPGETACAPWANCEYTNDDGSYAFKELPPGEYFVGIHIYLPPDTASPYPKVYAPGVEDSGGATPIKLDAGGHLDHLDIHIPRELVARDVDVYVLQPDGKPARNIEVYVQDADNGAAPSSNSRSITDEKGHAVLHLIDGGDYSIYTRLGIPGEEKVCGPVRVHVNEETPAVRMSVADPCGNCMRKADVRR